MKISFKLITISLAMVLIILSQSSSAKEFRLIPARLSQRDNSNIINMAEKDKMTSVVIFKTQLFVLERDKSKIGTLISGRGTYHNEGRENSTCFIAFIKANGESEYLKSVGQDEWEAEACISVSSVGLVHIKHANTPKIAIVYKAASPNTAVEEPIIFDLSKTNYKLTIDKNLTRKCSLAGAITIKKIRKLLNR